MMGTLVHVQLYTFSYRKPVIRPQNINFIRVFFLGHPVECALLPAKKDVGDTGANDGK